MLKETDITKSLFYFQLHLPDYEQKVFSIHLFSSPLFLTSKQVNISPTWYWFLDKPGSIFASHFTNITVILNR